MIIKFFEKNGVLDPDGIKPGVYIIKLGKVGNTQSMKPLYIGESYSMVSRCGRHLYELYKDPSYLGLKKEHTNDSLLCLSFEVYEVLENQTRGLSREARDAILKDHESKALLAQIEPTLTQTRTSDHVTRNRSKRVEEYLKELR